ncbi:S8 family serine peptidase, partial [uncultured Phyllobacterium sp.]|uniref:S8 family serine peptidase n=1 Tax=uncultured Phyllobacterium sp. TaxID=253813 RepID=UPI00258BF921
MFFHDSGAGFSARSDRLSKFRNHLMSSVCAALIVAAAGTGASAQEVPGKYFNADGSSTDDLEAAAKSWRTPEFNASWAAHALKAEYAYAMGFTGKEIRVGVLDSGVDTHHSDLSGPRIHPVTTSGLYYDDTSQFYFDGSKKPVKKGDPFNQPGIYTEGINDSHGTEVSGAIGAAKDGVGMQGLAFDAAVFVANTNGTDDNREQGSSNLDYNYFTANYNALGEQKVRIVNESWGQNSPIAAENQTDTTPQLLRAYQGFAAQNKIGRKTWLDATDEAVQKYHFIQVISASNDPQRNPDIFAVLPYLRPAIESNWLAVSGYSPNGTSPFGSQVYNQCGVAKYWCVMAPTDAKAPIAGGGYSEHFNGTSASAPYASAALALIMQRFPYLTSEQALSVMLTTSQEMIAVDSAMTPKKAPYDRYGKTYGYLTALKPGNTQLPNETTGWGLIDLKKAMAGPAQFLGRFEANLGAGVKDIWSNDISQVALDQRKREEAEEVAAWAKKKTSTGLVSDPTARLEAHKQLVNPEISAKEKAAEALLKELFTAVAAATKVTLNVTLTNSKIIADPLASALLADFKKAYPKAVTTYGTDPSADFAAYKAGRKEDPLAVLKQKMLDEQITSLETEYQFTESRTAYLSGKLADPKSYDAGLTKSGPGSLWLTGKNTYRGDTVINSGELGIGLGGSVVSTSVINDTGLLTVDGTAAAVTANAGGQLKVNATGATGDLMLNGG